MSTCLLCLLLYLVSSTAFSQNVTTAGINSTTPSSKIVVSDDLPEDYYTATATSSSETEENTTFSTLIKEDFNVTTFAYDETTAVIYTTEAIKENDTITTVHPRLETSIENENNTVTKPHKAKKKIVNAIDKTTTIKSILPIEKISPNETKDNKKFAESSSSDAGNSTRSTAGRSLADLIYSTTEGFKSSSLFYDTVHKLLNNNVLNVIDSTSNRPVEEPIKDDTYLGTTGQSDWIPIIGSTSTSSSIPHSERVPIKTYARPVDIPTAQSPFTPQINTVVTTTETNVIDSASEGGQLASEMDIPVTGPSWLLAGSKFIRKVIANKTEDSVVDDSKNTTQEKNEILKNTIPDTQIREPTPTPSKWQPEPLKLSTGTNIVEMTTKPELFSTYSTQSTTNNINGDNMASDESIQVNFSNLHSTTSQMTYSSTEDYTDLEHTMTYEIMKTTLPVIPLNQTNEFTTELSINHNNNSDIIVINATSSTTETVTVSITELQITEGKGSVDPETKATTTPEMKQSTMSEIKASMIPEPQPKPVRQKDDDPVSVMDVVTKIAEAEKEPYPRPTEYPLDVYEVKTLDTFSYPIAKEITEENVPAYLRLTIRTSEEVLCQTQKNLRTAILKMLSEGTGMNVSVHSIVFLNLNAAHCHPTVLSNKSANHTDIRLRPVNLFLQDSNYEFDKNLSEAFLTLWSRDGLDYPLPILKVDFVTPIVDGMGTEGLSSGVITAIVVSCVAGICLIFIGILFVIMKRRQRKFNYGQRCTPVSLDAYSLDSVSIRNSNRRKGARASKRSYGNPAFDESEVPSHPVNFAGLSNFATQLDQIYAEYNSLQNFNKTAKADELPPGADTKNRYANVIPLPETRVILTANSNDLASDYINANFVRGVNNTEQFYIACQGPLSSTINDFWRMIWEQQCKVILMVTNLQENGVEKCANYLPSNEVTDNTRVFGDFQVTMKKRDCKEKYTVTTLQLKNLESNLWREVVHLWYLDWPDSGPGVPVNPNSTIAYLIEARSHMKTASPAVVHCSPGTGRTGTIIACDICIREYEQKRLVDIPRCVVNLRRDRAGAIQNKEQYAFIYKVISAYATKLTDSALENI